MNHNNSLNKLIDTIEKNLENEIDYQELAKVIGTSAYAMQRIFTFLTGMTVTEYIRRRRLSKAAEELRKTNHKIIDIAIKYHYESPVSFSNAFKKIQGQSPANFRKSNTEMIFFPKIEFDSIIKGRKELKYRIVERKEQTFYGKTTGVIGEYDAKAIQDLYQEVIKDGTMDFFINHSKGKELYYGIFDPIFEKKQYTKKGKYYIVGTTPRDDLVEIKLSKCEWACFSLPNHEQNNILKLCDNIYNKWLPSSEYYLISQYGELEIYYEDECEICIPVQ